MNKTLGESRDSNHLKGKYRRLSTVGDKDESFVKQDKEDKKNVNAFRGREGTKLPSAGRVSLKPYLFKGVNLSNYKDERQQRRRTSKF